jgi:Thioredoxin-like [2Fe-2S] ferredoxin
MSDRQQKNIRPLTGHFLGWGDDCTPHRYLKLATTHGEKLIKVTKSLRAQIQDWQPGILVTLLCQERIDRLTGETKIKVKQLLMPLILNPGNQLVDRSPSLVTSDFMPVVATTKIRVCQGSSCRRQGSAQICQSMQTYLDRHHLAEQVQIESVKCLHQCKAAPHAIFTGSAGSILPGKTHYRQLQPSQVKTVLGKHFPVVLPSKLRGTSLIDKIAAYLQQNQISTSTTL